MAIPHTFSDSVDHVVAAFARSKEGVDFEAIDNAPVNYVMLFIVPKKERNLHLQTLAAVARMFNNCSVRQQLHDAETVEQVLDIFEAPFPRYWRRKLRADESLPERARQENLIFLTIMIQELEKALSAALGAAGIEMPEGYEVQVESSADLRFGDYQSNAAMVLAKRLRTNPRELAARVIELLDLGGLAVADIAGPGFINFRITQRRLESSNVSFIG